VPPSFTLPEHTETGPSPPVPVFAARDPDAYHRVVDTTLRNTLHERGFRMTPQRQLVLDSVRSLGHATPEQICAQVQEAAPAVNITTVYRTLDLLEKIGVVRHTHLGHGAPTYSEQEHQHVHLVCHECGAVLEAPTDLLEELTARLIDESGFALDATHVALSGRCAECRAAERRQEPEHA
jgi:Fur family ferric uptake transcriptional regulator